MFKVYIDAVCADMQCDNEHYIELHNEQELYNLRHNLVPFERHDGPFLVRLVEESDYCDAKLTRAHLCYGGDGIYRFIKREIERYAIGYGMRDVFQR